MFPFVGLSHDTFSVKFRKGKPVSDSYKTSLGYPCTLETTFYKVMCSTGTPYGEKIAVGVVGKGV